MPMVDVDELDILVLFNYSWNKIWVNVGYRFINNGLEFGCV